MKILLLGEHRVTFTILHLFTSNLSLKKVLGSFLCTASIRIWLSCEGH